MSRGFTLIELVLTLIVLAILSTFTFSVIWQYSDIYADARKGSVYGEAAAVLERMTRELRDAGGIDRTVVFLSNGATSTYISLLMQHATPADKQYLTPVGWPTVLYQPYWVQYCTCTPAGGKQRLYRVVNPDPAANACASCPPGGACSPPGSQCTALMSGNVTGFQVQYIQGNVAPNGPEGDSYQIMLQVKSDQATGSPSITLVSRVSPRNYAPYNPVTLTGIGSDRAFSGDYHDDIQ